MVITKKLFIIFLLIIILITFTCCSSGNNNSNFETSNEKIKLGFTVYFISEFAATLIESMEKEAQDLGAELIVLDAKNDPNLQLSQVENLIVQGVDSIIVAPVNADAILPARELCEEARVPLSFVNMEMNTDEPYYYVGPKEIHAGENAINWLVNNIGQDADICIMQGGVGYSATILRDKGIDNILAEYKDINVLVRRTGEWNREAAMNLMENWIQTYGEEIDAVVVHDDEMAIGVIQAVQESSLKDKIRIIACADGIEEACRAIVNGQLDVTMFQDVYLEGKLSIQMAMELAKGNEVTPYFEYIEMTPIDKEQAQDLLDNYYNVG